MAKALFTADEKKILHSLMHQTWQTIGYDVLQMNEGKPVSRIEVCELVIDADRLRDMARTDEEKAIVSKFYDLKDFKKMCRYAKETFTYKRYGM